MNVKLKMQMVNFGDKQVDLAEVLGITYQTLSMKIKGKNAFTDMEIATIAQRYNLSPEQVYEIFIEGKKTS